MGGALGFLEGLFSSLGGLLILFGGDGGFGIEMPSLASMALALFGFNCTEAVGLAGGLASTFGVALIEF